ncbi:MAG: CvpA family protein [Oscillospiraceae bacterium]|nr:CvpA family protein [Oscillospiraceae bacterium]
MQNIAIIDFVLAAVLVGFVVFGAARGLYRSLAGLLVLVLAIAGAGWLTETCAAGVEDVLRPPLTRRMESIVSDAMGEETAKIEDIADTEPILAVEQFLRRFGWEGDLGETVRESAENALTDVEKALASALVESVLPVVVAAVLKAVFFVVLFVVLRLLSRLLQPLIEHLPVIRQFNRLLGGAAGFLQGVVAIFVAFWLVERLGLAGDLLAKSHLLSLFIR